MIKFNRLNIYQILEINKESFRIDQFSKKNSRVVGLVDAKVKYTYGVETVTFAYYRTTGTNDGKIKGLWYPIIGIKLLEGEFSEFSEYINHVLTNTTVDSIAIKGWLCKSLFFGKLNDKSKKPGFSNGKHYNSLLEIGETLQKQYESGRYKKVKSLDSKSVNQTLYSLDIYDGNKHTQRENFEKFVQDIYSQFK